MNRNKIPAYYRKKGMPGFFIMQRVREMVAGNVREGLDGDLVLVERESLEIQTVIALGKVMLRDGNLLVKGSFE